MISKNFKMKIKNQENGFYRILFKLYYMFKHFNVRYPRFLSNMLYQERNARLTCWNNFKRIFYYEPMFRSRCNQVGKSLNLIGGLPYISTGLEMNIGDGCTIYGVSNFELVDIRNKGILNIGSHTLIGHRNVISVALRVDIGNYVILSPEVRIRDNGGHHFDPIKRRQNEALDEAAIKPVVIEDDVWVGPFTIINKGVRIGKGSIIGAGSIVTKDIPPLCIAAGNPAQVIKKLEFSPDSKEN